QPLLDLAVAPTGSFALGDATYSVRDTTPVLNVTVARSGSTLGAAGVTLATGDGTARAGVDYTATTTAVNFPEGVATVDVSIPILNAPAKGPVTFTVTLSTPTGGPALGARKSATATITDGDPDTTPPTVVKVDVHRTTVKKQTRIDGLILTFSEALDAGR